jgi:hypothetical protein
VSGAIPQQSAGDGDDPRSSAGDTDGQRTVVVIGEGDLTEETARALEASGARVSLLREPNEDDVREALDAGHVHSVAVVAGEDPIVLRMALMVRAVSDDVSLLLTIFDPTMAREWPTSFPTRT